MPFLDDVLRPAHRGGGIGAGENLADDQPVEQHADRRQVLLDSRGSVTAAENLDIGRDVVRAHRRERRDVLGVEPGEKRAHRDGVGGAGVRVADVGGEEVEKPQAAAFTSDPTASASINSSNLIPMPPPCFSSFVSDLCRPAPSCGGCGTGSGISTK